MRGLRILPALLGTFLVSAQARAQPARARLQRATVTVLATRSLRGVVLSGNGRIVAPLQATESTTTLRVRYPDGRVDRARVVAADPAWGVALLEGFAGHWPEGLVVATREGRSGDSVSWLALRGRTVAGTLHRRRTFVGEHSILLRDAWELAPAPGAQAVGSGVVGADGQLLAVVVAPATRPGPGGPTAPFAVPSPVLRTLVAQAGDPTRPYLGLVARELGPGESANVASPEGGIRITVIQPEGPAHRAGLRAGETGDVIVGVDDGPVRTVSDLGQALESHRPGDVIVLHIVRAGTQIDVPVQLETFRAAPSQGPD